MQDSPARDELLRMIGDAKAEWEATSALVQPEDLEKPVLDGWSVKDVIAHLMWHENEMLGVVSARRLVGSDLWNHPLNERNRLIWEHYRDLPLAKLREEARTIHEALIKELATVDDMDLTEPGRWPGMQPDWQLGRLMAENTYEHYRDHTMDLKRYLVGLAG